VRRSEVKEWVMVGAGDSVLNIQTPIRRTLHG